MRKNVILIIIDCLRVDHLGCYGYSRKTSPFIDSLAAKGTILEAAFANGPFTAASFLSILSSAYPLGKGKYRKPTAKSSIPFTVEALIAPNCFMAAS